MGIWGSEIVGFFGHIFEDKFESIMVAGYIIKVIIQKLWRLKIYYVTDGVSGSITT